MIQQAFAGYCLWRDSTGWHVFQIPAVFPDYDSCLQALVARATGEIMVALCRPETIYALDWMVPQ